MTANPFLFGKDPYARNPFVILGISTPNVSPEQLEFQVQVKEEEVLADPSESLQPSDMGEAFAALKDPHCRIVFELMHFGYPLPKEKQP